MNAINEVVGTTATLSVLGGLDREELQIRLVFGHSHGVWCSIKDVVLIHG